jgi:hypothetical protein
VDLINNRLKRLKETSAQMKRGEALEIVRGSGNVLRDLDRDNAGRRAVQAILAAEIIKARLHDNSVASALTRF